MNVTTTRQLFETCRRLVSDPATRQATLDAIRPRCRGIVGCFSNYIPEEIVAAAGFHPVRMIGAFAPSAPHRRLFNPVCSFVQDVYAAACAGEFASLDRVVFPNSCDSLKVLFQMWARDVSAPPAAALMHPVCASPEAVAYFAQRLRAFAEDLQQSPGRRFDDDDLKDTIDLYNETRDLLRQVYEMRSRRAGCLSGADAAALMTAGLILERPASHAMLRQVIDDTRYAVCPDKGAKRIMLIGPLMDNIALLDAVEGLGASIVYEETSNGARYCDGDVETQGDLYENLARRYLTAGPSPTFGGDAEQEAERFRRRAAELDVDGVIYVNQKYCEPHVHNYLSKAEILKQMQIHVLMFEVEHGQSDLSAGDMLRLESFIEIAKRR